VTRRPVVGIVLVSHSRALAEGAAELAGQMAAGAVPVVAAGGTDDGRLGTSADLIAAAIGAADRGDGVLLVPDLGSAVLTARALLAERDAGGPRVELVDAPFVEGAVAAAVAASAGLDLDAVAAAAREARDVAKF
jgi:PTS hybrid protein